MVKKRKLRSQAEKWGDKYFSVGSALELLGKGALVTAYIVIPGAAVAGKYVMDLKDWAESGLGEDSRGLKGYDRSRLRGTFARLHVQKDIKIVMKDGARVVRLTKKGKKKWLRYRLGEMKLDKSNWDGKWRLISYDVTEKNRSARDMLRRMLKRLECREMHRSLYLTPYMCEDEVEYLRQVFGVGDEVVLVVASEIEGEEELKRAFGLK